MERKTFATRIDIQSLKALKHLAVDEGRPIASLVEEAVNDLLKKYSAQGPAKGKAKP